jgi:hypothetical protein
MAMVMIVLNNFLITSLLFGFAVKTFVGTLIYFIIVYNLEKALVKGLLLKVKKLLKIR